jgi:hypothetical protein
MRSRLRELSSPADGAPRALAAGRCDHIGAKTGNVMRLARNKVGVERMRDEIARCVVRCANCHRRRTAQAGGHYRARVKVPPARVELALRD